MSIPLEDLPYWMRQARRGRDWGALIVLAFSIIAAWPLLSQSDLPLAAENYVYMTADYSATMRDGRLYPRWSPNALGGYGAPIPNFFPPAAPYSAALIKTLFTDDAQQAVRVVFSAAFILAALSSYAFVRRRSTASAGLLAALLYLYSPYLGHTLPYVRGDLALVLALALLPVFLWAYDRLLVDNRPADLLLTALAGAALLLADPLVAAAGLLIGFILLLHDIASRPDAWLRLLMALCLSIGLSAFYWLPALLESSQVYWLPNAASPALTLDSLFAMLRPTDPGALIPSPQLTLGIALPLLNLIALVAILRHRMRFHAIFMLTGISLLIPGLFFVPQEHWLLGISSFCLALSATAALRLLLDLSLRLRLVAQVALTSFVLLTSLNNFSAPTSMTSTFNTEALSQVLYEQQRFGIAVLPAEAALPSPLPEIPATNRLLLSGYENGSINKIDPTQATNNARINLISHQAQRDRFQVTSQSALTLNLLTAYYPGWTATAAGQPISLAADPQTGLIVLTVPPMNGELVLEFGTTPQRTSAWLLSLSALLVMLYLSWRRFQGDSGYPPESSRLGTAEGIANSVLILGFAGLVLLFALPDAPFASPVEPGSGLEAAQNLRHRSEVGLEALAYRLNTDTLSAGDPLAVTIYWRTVTPLSTNYQTRLSLRNIANNDLLIQTENRAPGHFPTSRWRSFLYVSDKYNLTLPEDSPPGQYHLRIEVFECNPACGDTLTFFTADGRNIEQASILDTLIRIVE